MEDLENEVIDPQLQEGEPQPSPEPEAPQSGPQPMSKEEWVDKGNDPDKWKTPEAFAEAGVWIERQKAMQKRMDDMENGFNDQLQGINKLHQIQQDNLKTQLTAKRDAAIADFDQPAAQAAQNEIDNLQPAQQAAPVQTQKRDPAIVAFEQANPWSLTPGEKQDYANVRLNSHTQAGMSLEAALQQVEADVRRAYPDINPARQAPPAAEQGSKPGAQRQARPLAMSDLTADERACNVPGMWGSDAEFLKAVENDRKRTAQ